MTGMLSAWQALREVIRAASAFGARFRIVGADVEAAGLEGLPEKLRIPLERVNRKWCGMGISRQRRSRRRSDSVPRQVDD